MGIAPVNAWPLAWIAMVPLWLLAYNQPDRQTIASCLSGGAIWGMAYHGTALSWITGLHPLTWMGVPWIGSIAIALFAWAFITLWGAAIGLSWLGLMWIVTRRFSAVGISRVVLGTALWCAVEWIWSSGPLYWTSLSYTQSPGNLWILQLGQLSGPITVTAAIVAVNGLIAEGCAEGSWVRSHFEPSRIKKVEAAGKTPLNRWWIRAIGFFLLLHLAGWGLYARPLADSADGRLSVGLIQGNIPTREKLTSQGVRASQRAYLTGYNQLASEGADLVVTPEGAIPQVWNAFTLHRNLLLRAVVDKGVPLVLGTFVHEDIEDSQTPLTQSLLTLVPEGSIGGRYKKVKLVPLGEYIPFESVLGAVISRLSPYGESMVPGGFDQVLETPFGPMAAGICYESAFAALFQGQVHRGGQAILTASNNDPYPPRQMLQQHAQDVMRAIENDRWMVRVTNTGISGVVDPKGRSRWMSKPNTSATYLSTIYKRQSRTAYVRWGDWLTPVLLVTAVVLLWISSQEFNQTDI
ncbi:apolipoprotein N-acyltransferase [cf. Phormidesmis sp. LEGE 11477]|nr:apolipoprotein N-acyltransferase [cf. Phormidesmis sp. LEGE 11477]